MPALHGYLQKVASKHGDRHPEMNKVFQTFLRLLEKEYYSPDVHDGADLVQMPEVRRNLTDRLYMHRLAG